MSSYNVSEKRDDCFLCCCCAAICWSNLSRSSITPRPLVSSCFFFFTPTPPPSHPSRSFHRPSFFSNYLSCTLLFLLPFSLLLHLGRSSFLYFNPPTLPLLPHDFLVIVFFPLPSSALLVLLFLPLFGQRGPRWTRLCIEAGQVSDKDSPGSRSE